MKCVCFFVFPRRQSAGMQPNSIQGRIFPWDLSDVKFDLLKVTGQSCDITPKYFLTSIFSFYSRKSLSFSIFILIQNQKLGVFFPLWLFVQMLACLWQNGQLRILTACQ